MCDRCTKSVRAYHWLDWVTHPTVVHPPTISSALGLIVTNNESNIWEDNAAAHCLHTMPRNMLHNHTILMVLQRSSAAHCSVNTLKTLNHIKTTFNLAVGGQDLVHLTLRMRRICIFYQLCSISVSKVGDYPYWWAEHYRQTRLKTIMQTHGLDTRICSCLQLYIMFCVL